MNSSHYLQSVALHIPVVILIRLKAELDNCFIIVGRPDSRLHIE